MVGLDEQQRQAADAGAAGAHCGQQEVRLHGARDQGLAAVDDEVIAPALGGGDEARDIRAAAGLGDRKRDFLVAG
ncbi:hypothetical protein D3C87_1241160 [compost metagenome]